MSSNAANLTLGEWYDKDYIAVYTYMLISAMFCTSSAIWEATMRAAYL